MTILVLALLAALLPGAALAQDAGDAADDLRDYDVTFEEGVLSDNELEELDRIAARLQEDEAFLKVVVLAEPVDSYPSVSAFAEAVLEELGGGGRVLVYDPNSVGVASDVDSAAEVASAEQSARREANESDSYVAGAQAAVAALGGVEGTSGDGGGGGGSAGEEPSGGGFSLWSLLVFGALAFVAYWLFKALAGGGGRRKQDVGQQALAEGEKKVREAVNRVSNLIIELYDAANRPDAPRPARAAYEEGSRLFVDLQDELEKADTPAELESVYPMLRRAQWRLQVAEALFAGREAPPEPTVEPLFQAPAAAAVTPGVPGAPTAATGQPAPPVSVPERHYQGSEMSPWLTQAAMMALGMLMGGMGGGWRSPYRPPMSDWDFGDFTGGGGRGFGRGMGGRSLARGMGGRIRMGRGRGRGRR
jgi:hypothetical protein